MRKVVICCALVVACGHHEDTAAGGKGADVPDPVAAGTPTLQVSSTAFAAGASIPTEHTCEGADRAPPLAWSGAPPATRSYALVVDDPDAPDPAAPKRTWVHWVLVNIPANVTSLPAGGAPPQGAAAGKNDWSKAEWGGPCPPIGRHRYFFKIYALDGMYGKAGMTKAELLLAIQGHVVGSGELIGTYQKQKK